MQQIKKLITQTNPDHIYCQLIRTAEYVKHINIPNTIEFQDVFSIGSKRRAQISKGLLRWFFMMEYQRLVKYEKAMFDLFDNHTIISEPDRELLPHSNRQSVAIIPNGVDFNYFTPIKNVKKYHIVFTGNMGYPPNIDAARFLANEILPIVKKTIPDISLLIAGATPHTRVLELQSENIHVSGWMPDIREAYSSATIFIAPMRIGTGLQNKLLEAMAMQIPCITSEMANQALGAKSRFEILVGNSAGEFATHIINLLNDKDLAVCIAENGRQFVNSNYDWEAATQKLEHIFEQSKTKD
jgi:glycosyltransferase involved in cell wall biosynthesis